ncbi:MAG: hypothetical protein ACMV1K_03465 [Sulfurospirillum sp.]
MNGFEVLSQTLTVESLIESLKALPQDAIVKGSVEGQNRGTVLSLFGIFYNDKEVIFEMTEDK